jgi:hypothetical protein
MKVLEALFAFGVVVLTVLACIHVAQVEVWTSSDYIVAMLVAAMCTNLAAKVNTNGKDS